MVLSLKLGALALLSTLGSVWHQYGGSFTSTSPVDPEQRAAESIFVCATRFGGDALKASQAQSFVDGLDEREVEEAINLTLDTQSPLHQMFSSLDKNQLAEFEDCAALRPGLASAMIDTAGIKQSAYRSFLKSSMKCAAQAFRAADRKFPSEMMMLDMYELMSLDWLSSSMLTMEIAAKYKPIISAMPSDAKQMFQDCMQGIASHPGSPAISKRAPHKKQPVHANKASINPNYGEAIAEITGMKQLEKPPARQSAQTNQLPTSGPNRRLMKGFFFFSSFSFFSDCDDDDSCTGAGEWSSCFSDSATVWNPDRQQTMSIGEVRPGDYLTTTVERDQVWYLHSSEHAVPMLRLELADKSSIELTPHHMLSTPTGMQMASALKPGHLVVSSTDQHLEIVAVSSTKGKVSAPLTMSGTIVVNGVVASCYAFGSHGIIHAALAPWRALYSVSPKLCMTIAQPGLQVLSALRAAFPTQDYLVPMLITSIVAALSIPLGVGCYTAACLKRRFKF